jgi:hypothetical protein
MALPVRTTLCVNRHPRRGRQGPTKLAGWRLAVSFSVGWVAVRCDEPRCADCGGDRIRICGACFFSFGDGLWPANKVRVMRRHGRSAECQARGRCQADISAAMALSHAPGLPAQVPASPPRSRAVWARRRALQPPLRRPGVSACHGGRSASGSNGTVKFVSKKPQLPHHCPPQGFPGQP